MSDDMQTLLGFMRSVLELYRDFLATRRQSYKVIQALMLTGYLRTLKPCMKDPRVVCLVNDLEAALRNTYLRTAEEEKCEKKD